MGRRTMAKILAKILAMTDDQLARSVERSFPGAIQFASEPKEFEHIVHMPLSEFRGFLSSISERSQTHD